ncbi:MAG: bacteriophage abortive infection AbiH family protein [Ruminococcus sp.]|nr:bacteriophage abortive infection AbiH family protein [Ruminococcus sp.]
MNITFLIGNGFDVNLGLKTKYKDFYDKYIESNAHLSNENCIKKFCDKIDPNHETWSDFELAFAQNIEGTPEEIRNILGDFSIKFANYLRQQLKICNYDDNSISSKFKSFLTNSCNLLETRDRSIMHNAYESRMKNNDNIRVNFIDFNYTNTLDQIYELYINKNNNSGVLRKYGTNNNYNESLGDILHIHGTLDDLIIIGIDSLQQISNEDLKSNNFVEKYCVKRKMNEEYGYSQIENKYVQMINDSKIIYAYGISFGESDHSRWIVINNWLRKDSGNKIIIFKYGTNFKQYDRTYRNLLLDAINDAKREYLNLLGFTEDECEKYFNQIFIIDSTDVLQFTLITNSQESTQENTNPEEETMPIPG